ncbi:hypothetical protein HO173_002664 [Letharia columbiana]|uniref:Rhodopsin domain-containing protein n=1 Tax=Letharia columbiana TaxID=112416 RepID=A0A8H6G2W8_9LECA|nr:uncharacterized protein HO173_002664 [Letharia columbiana]KAF6239402.1 hypothetical protein HO173_002664 [Letharia columbiana]
MLTAKSSDWLAVATLPFIVAQNVTGVYWTTIGLGKHISLVSPDNIVKGLLLLYADYPLYDTAISLPRFSALLFYARVFNAHSNRLLRTVLWTTAALNMAWLIFAIVSSIFQCTPIEKVWKPSIQGHCINTYDWWMSSAISSVIIDLIILLIPLPILWKLQLPPLRKYLLLGVFVCGYCVIVISIGRLVADIKAGPALVEDFTYNVVPITYWLSLEAPVSIVSICLPSIFSFIKRGIQGGPYSLLTSKNEASLHFNEQRGDITAYQGEGLGGLHGGETSIERLYINERANQHSATAFKSHSSESSQKDAEELAMDAIRVRQDLNVSVQ